MTWNLFFSTAPAQFKLNINININCKQIFKPARGWKKSSTKVNERISISKYLKKARLYVAERVKINENSIYYLIFDIWSLFFSCVPYRSSTFSISELNSIFLFMKANFNSYLLWHRLSSLDRVVYLPNKYALHFNDDDCGNFRDAPNFFSQQLQKIVEGDDAVV